MRGARVAAVLLLALLLLLLLWRRSFCVVASAAPGEDSPGVSSVDDDDDVEVSFPSANAHAKKYFRNCGNWIVCVLPTLFVPRTVKLKSAMRSHGSGAGGFGWW